MMGLCLEGNDRVSVEIRRESFVVHPEEWPPLMPHPEFALRDLDPLIAALDEARVHLVPASRDTESNLRAVVLKVASKLRDLAAPHPRLSWAQRQAFVDLADELRKAVE